MAGQGQGELAEQGRRWECCDEQPMPQGIRGAASVWERAGQAWERAGQATPCNGVIAAPTTSDGSGEPQAKRTQSCAAAKQALATTAGPSCEQPLPCLAFLLCTRSPAPRQAPGFRVGKHHFLGIRERSAGSPSPPAGFLRSTTANHKGRCPKPQRRITIAQAPAGAALPGHGGRHAASPRTQAKVACWDTPRHDPSGTSPVLHLTQ